MEHIEAGRTAPSTRRHRTALIAFGMAAALALGMCIGQGRAYAERLMAAQDDAAQAYAVYREGPSNSIALYYDALMGTEQREGTVFVLGSDDAFAPLVGGTAWTDACASASAVVIDESMRNFEPASTARWFSGARLATSYEGLGNLNMASCESTRSMFENNSSLASIDVSGWSMAKAADLGSMFNGCSSLRNIEGLATWAGCKPRTIDSLFAGCGQLESSSLVGLNAWDVSDLQSAAYLFANDNETAGPPESKLESIDLSNWHTDNPADLTEMFYGCTGLHEVKIGSVEKPVKANSTSLMFALCYELGTLDLHGLDTSSVSNMSNMFLACCVSAPDTGVEEFNVSNVTNFEGMFQGSAISTTDASSAYGQLLDLSAWDVSQGESFSRMFQETRTSLDLTGWKISESADITDIFADSGMERIYYVPGPGMSSIAKKGETAASDNDNLVGVNGTVTFSNKNESGYANSSLLRVPEQGAGGVFSVYPESTIQYDLTSEKGKSVATPGTQVGTSGEAVVLSSPIVAGKSVRWTTKEDGKGRSFEPGSTVYRPVRGLRLYAQWYDSPTAAYAVLDDKGTLTLRHGNDFGGFPGTILGTSNQAFVTDADPDETDIPWYGVRNKIRAVVVDKSFAALKPKSLARWFSGLTACTSITGLENIDVSQVETADGAFEGCARVQALDLSGWQLASLQSAEGMFAGCSGLRCIVADETGWRLPDRAAETMFAGCENLAGYDSSRAVELGKNPVGYDAAHVDASMARLPSSVAEEGEAAGGYFSDSAWTARKLAVGSSATGTAEVSMPATGTHAVPQGATVALGDPALAGAHFAGWAATGEGGTADIAWTTGEGTRSFTMPADDIALDAQFTCTVDFTSADEATTGITWNGDIRQTVAFGQTVTPPKPTRAGQLFAGWFADASCSTAWNENAPVTRHATIYARWAEAGELVVTLSAYSATYNGTRQMPTITAMNGDGSVLDGADYAVSWTYEGEPFNADAEGQFVNAGTYTATATDASGGEDARTASATFVIEKAEIHPTVSIEGWTYADAANSPVVGGAGEAPSSFDYKAADSEADFSPTVPTEAGDYVVRAAVSETPNFKAATATCKFSISPLGIEDERVRVSTERVTYAGAKQAAPVAVTFDGEELGGTDYSIDSLLWNPDASEEPATTVQAVEDAGAYRATIRGQGNFSGTRDTTFVVDPKLIGTGTAPTTGMVVSVPDCAYAGKGQLPNPIITWQNDNGESVSLHMGADFKVSNGDANDGVGTGTATVEGTGNYAGNFPVEFAIVQASFESDAFSIATGADAESNFGVTNDGFPVQLNPTVTFATQAQGVVELSPETDYEVRYQMTDSSEPQDSISGYGRWLVIIEGKGKFTGETAQLVNIIVPRKTLTLVSDIEGVSLQNEASRQYDVGQTVTLDDPILADASFGGWRVANADELPDELAIERFDGNHSRFAMPDGDVVLEPTFAHKIIFMSADPQADDADAFADTNWGEGAEPGISLTVTVPYGETLGESDLPTPAVEGKVFDGWFADQQFTTRWNPESPLGANTTVYGRWMEPGTMELTLNPNRATYARGGYDAPAETASLITTDNERIRLARDDYTLSWAFGGAAISANDKFIDAGVYEATANGMVGQAGGKNATATFTIEPASMEAASVTVPASSYEIKAGETVAPEPTVTLDGFGTLDPAEYDVRYKRAADPDSDEAPDSNLYLAANAAGTWNVVVSGKGNFSGQAGQTPSFAVTVASQETDPKDDPGDDPKDDPKDDPSDDPKDDPDDKPGTDPAGGQEGGSTNTGSGNAGNTDSTGKTGSASDGTAGTQDNAGAQTAATPTIVKKLVPSKRALTVKWAKRAGKVSGYQIRYSTKKNMKGAKKRTVKKATTTKLKIKKLKAKKRYYVQIRTYKKVNGKTYFSSWSKKKSVKTK